MTSIALGVFIIFILYIMFWIIKNDGARSIGDQTGFIRMHDPSGAVHKPAGQSGHRRRQVAKPRPSERTRKRR
jgi:hypothetical protein